MALKTIPFRDIEKLTKEMYEATVVAAKRARQIIADRRAHQEIQEYEDEPELMAEPPAEMEEYMEQGKATTVALREFLEGEIEWSYGDEEEAGEEGTI